MRVICLLLVLLTSCSGLDGQSLGQIGGGVLGGGIGGYAGSRIGGTPGAVIGSLGFGAAGVWLGGELGKYLSDADKQRASSAAQTAATTNQTQSWRDQSTGVKGRARVVHSEVRTSPGKPQQECRTVQQTIELADGREETTDVKACKTANGWAVVNA